MPIKQYTEDEARLMFDLKKQTNVGDIVYIKRFAVYGVITEHEYVKGYGETTPSVMVRFKPFDRTGARLLFNGYTDETDCEDACLYIDKCIEKAENNIRKLNDLKDKIQHNEIMKG